MYLATFSNMPISIAKLSMFWKFQVWLTTMNNRIQDFYHDWKVAHEYKLELYKKIAFLPAQWLSIQQENMQFWKHAIQYWKFVLSYAKHVIQSQKLRVIQNVFIVREFTWRTNISQFVP